MAMSSFVAVILAVAAMTVAVDADACLGEFELCPSTGECTLYNGWCGTCKAGQYVCPDGKTCVADAAGYLECPGLAGTHLDWVCLVIVVCRRSLA